MSRSNENKKQLISKIIESKNNLNEILKTLQDEKIIDFDIITKIQLSRNQETMIFEILEKAIKDGKIQLIEYFWTILPTENIKLTIVFNTFIKNWEKIYEQ